jgi:DNA-binding MarR family transcriptional regulator
MKKTPSSFSNYDLFLLMGNTNHLIGLARRREFSQFGVSPQQLYVLRIIQELQPKATLSGIAKYAQREINAISRQTINMETDGLIKRVKDKPKSRLLKLELTGKGFDILKNSRESKSVNDICSILSKDEQKELYSSLSKIYNKLKKELK